MIIKGNPRLVRDNPKADQFYDDLKRWLTDDEGFDEVTFDPGKAWTQPKPADLWVGHSRGADRLRFADDDTVTVAIGAPPGDEDIDLVLRAKGDTAAQHVPDPDHPLKRSEIPPEHWTLTSQMKKALANLLQSEALLEGPAMTDSSNLPRREKLQIDVPEDLRTLAGVFHSAGSDLYLVGGAVRDAVMGKAPKDWDVATSLPPDQVVRILGDAGYRVIPVGEAFGVVRALTPQGSEYEVATFRTEEGYSDGRRPDRVNFSGIEDDVRRRDLTINALFYDLGTGEVVDYVGGLDDLRDNRIRTVGRPEDRFGEDRLRVLRVLRFAARTGGTVDPETLDAIRRDPSLRGVSPERVRDEFLKGVHSAQDLGVFLDLFTTLGLWDQVFPGLQVNPGFGAGASGSSPVVVLASLLSGNSPDTVRKTLNSLKYTSDEAAGAALLLQVANNLSPDNAWKLWRAWNPVRTKVTPADLQAFQSVTGRPDRKLLDAWIRFEPAVSPKDLQSQGFAGKALGQEIDRLESDRFRSLVVSEGQVVDESMSAGGGAFIGPPLQNLLQDPTTDQE